MASLGLQIDLERRRRPSPGRRSDDDALAALQRDDDVTPFRVVDRVDAGTLRVEWPPAVDGRTALPPATLSDRADGPKTPVPLSTVHPTGIYKVLGVTAHHYTP